MYASACYEFPVSVRPALHSSIVHSSDKSKQLLSPTSMTLEIFLESDFSFKDSVFENGVLERKGMRKAIVTQ